jgi:putative membrane protein
VNNQSLEPQDPRVRFAAERTLLAWLRTGLALMGFGFVVARFGLFLREIAAIGHIPIQQHATGSSLWIGVGLISLGIAISLLACYEYYRFIQASKLGQTYLPRTVLLAVVVAVILGLLGVVMAIYLIMLAS